MPRFLHSPRYDAMERHFDSVGPAGRRMMRATASTQICLDWWPGRTGLEQWRVLLLAAPFLAAATARCTGPRSRLATWLEVDPSRTAFDDRLLRGDDPVAAYADFAAGATAFADGGVDEHLSTLFPPVRPRGRYLEVRFPDARPAADVAPLADGPGPPALRRRAASDRPGDTWPARRPAWPHTGPRPRRVSSTRRSGCGSWAGWTGRRWRHEHPRGHRPARHPGPPDRREHRADGRGPGTRLRRLDLRPGGPRGSRRPGARPGAKDRAAAAAARWRPSLAGRAAVVHRCGATRPSTWPTRPAWC